MKYRADELTGALLDAAVAKAEGLEFEIAPYRVTGDVGITFVRSEPVCVANSGHFEPSTSWLCGGALVEREGIAIEPNDDFCDVSRADKSPSGTAWHSYFVHDARHDGCQRSFATGPTPLVAAMRAFVIGRVGDEVEL